MNDRGRCPDVLVSRLVVARAPMPEIFKLSFSLSLSFHHYLLLSFILFSFDKIFLFLMSVKTFFFKCLNETKS